MPSILVVEDEEIIRTSLCKLLTREGYELCAARHIDDALQQYNLNNFSLIISDLRLPGAKGTDLIHMAENIPVLIMTSYASLRSAVDTMRMGAVDYISKPYSHSEMIAAVKRILNKPKQPATDKHTIDTTTCGMVGNSPAIKQLLDMVGKVAPTDATVLICGETGSGKQLAATAIHNQSPRSQQPIISVNCAAIAASSIEAELFGHEKGTFSGATEARSGLVAAAHQGTLFLNQIDALPAPAQTHLLRVLQENEVRPLGSTKSHNVDIRLVAATHCDLKQLCEQGKFRQDLYYRINVVNLSTPALRERGNDVVKIAQHLLQKFAVKFDKKGQSLAPDALQAIASYHWPGNLRQLENVLQQAVILNNNGTTLKKEQLALEPLPTVAQHQPSPNDTDPADDLSLQDYFTRFVMEHQNSMSETELARKLGISRKCLWERRQKLGIPRQVSELKVTKK